MTSAQATPELAGASALVAGGNSGIGRATARALAGQGAHLVISGRDKARGEKAVEEIRATGGEADFVAGELSDEASARELAAHARERAGKVDILVNNAGIYPFGPTADTTERDFDAVFSLNAKAPYFVVAELARSSTCRRWSPPTAIPASACTGRAWPRWNS